MSQGSDTLNEISFFNIIGFLDTPTMLNFARSSKHCASLVVEEQIFIAKSIVNLGMATPTHVFPDAHTLRDTCERLDFCVFKLFRDVLPRRIPWPDSDVDRKFANMWISMHYFAGEGEQDDMEL